MKLARKLQLAYLSLLLIPALIVGLIITATYFSGYSNLGPYADMKAPGWIKAELALILDSNWESYASLRERIIFFVMDDEGLMLFPDFANTGLDVDVYPFLDRAAIRVLEESGLSPMTAGPGVPPFRMADIMDRFGTDWTLDLTFSPAEVNGRRYLVGWVSPEHGIPGFFARRGWIMPLFFLSGVLFIPALIDARLRRSIRRLQEASARLASGELDQPIDVLKKDDLKDLAATLERTRLELKDTRDRRSRFLMAVSHDLRTPLTSIKGYVEALNDGLADTPEAQERYLAVLEEKAGLLEGRIDELIDFARSETGGWQSPRELLDGAELMANLDAAFARDAGFAGKTYQSRMDLPGRIPLRGDYRTLYRAWENLFSNALRHTGDGDALVFRAGLAEDSRLFGEVEDSGPGVPPEFVDRLFEPFARADRGRNAAGLGLGLASVKSVAEAHGGTVTYRPARPRGSVFRIEIPLD